MINYTREDNKVIAKIEDSKYDLVNRLIKRMGRDKDKLSPEVLKLAELPECITAVAKCHPDDVFDMEEGKKQSRKRVIEKYNKIMAKTEGKVRCAMLEVLEKSKLFDVVMADESVDLKTMFSDDGEFDNVQFGDLDSFDELEGMDVECEVLDDSEDIPDVEVVEE